MSKRAEFSKATCIARFKHAKGCCETCGNEIVGGAEYDHAVPCAVGGTNDFDNCRCLCVRCHRIKTSKVDVPQIAKSVRIFEKRAGVRKTRPMPGSKRSGLRKRMDGTVERR